jgi:hypothetical protein
MLDLLRRLMGLAPAAPDPTDRNPKRRDTDRV